MCRYWFPFEGECERRRWWNATKAGQPGLPARPKPEAHSLPTPCCKESRHLLISLSLFSFLFLPLLCFLLLPPLLRPSVSHLLPRGGGSKQKPEFAFAFGMLRSTCTLQRAEQLSCFWRLSALLPGVNELQRGELTSTSQCGRRESPPLQRPTNTEREGKKESR